MTPEEILERSSKITWWHRMELAPGIWTDGEGGNETLLEELYLPKDMTGLRVLDIGAWDGAYSFACEKKGAEVTASDYQCWGGWAWGTKDGFNLAHEVYNSKVKSVECDLYALTPETAHGQFDIVLFLGVLYHLQDPFAGIRHVEKLVAPGGCLILETVLEINIGSKPTMVFYEKNELGNDFSNWWGPNSLAVLAMLRAAGFARVEPGVQRAGGKRGIFYAYR